MLVVGLTGGIGSGKSTVAGFLEDFGVEVVDADMLAREVVAAGTASLTRIAEHFGQDILNTDGELARNKLRDIIFAEPAQKDWLENLLFPLIADLMNTKIANFTSEYCMLVSPLLLETDQHKLVDRVLVVDVSEQTQIERTLRRDQSSESTIRSIIASQVSRRERLQKADDILDNEQEISALKIQAALLHKQYLALARENHAPNAN